MFFKKIIFLKWVVLTPEYYTTVTCYKCKNKMEKLYKEENGHVTTTRKGKQIHSKCNHCKCFISRDVNVNAAKNIRERFLKKYSDHPPVEISVATT